MGRIKERVLIDLDQRPAPQTVYLFQSYPSSPLQKNVLLLTMLQRSSWSWEFFSFNNQVSLTKKTFETSCHLPFPRSQVLRLSSRGLRKTFRIMQNGPYQYEAAREPYEDSVSIDAPANANNTEYFLFHSIILFVYWKYSLPYHWMGFVLRQIH